MVVLASPRVLADDITAFAEGASGIYDFLQGGEETGALEGNISIATASGSFTHTARYALERQFAYKGDEAADSMHVSIKGSIRQIQRHVLPVSFTGQAFVFWIEGHKTTRYYKGNRLLGEQTVKTSNDTYFLAIDNEPRPYIRVCKSMNLLYGGREAYETFLRRADYYRRFW